MEIVEEFVIYVRHRCQSLKTERAHWSLAKEQEMMGTSSKTLCQSLLGKRAFRVQWEFARQIPHGEEAEPGLKQPWMIDSDLSPAVSHDAASPTGKPPGPMHSTKHHRVSLGNTWLHAAHVLWPLGRHKHTHIFLKIFQLHICAVVMLHRNSCDTALT